MPSLAAGLHKTSVRLIVTPGGIVWASLRVDWRPGANLKVGRYELIRSGRRPPRTIRKSARHLTTPTFSAAGLKNIESRHYVVILTAVRPNGRRGPALAVTLAPNPRPTGLRKDIPHWAWPYLRWQHTRTATRGATPKHPSLLPTWYRTWAAWRLHPIRITR